MAIKNIKNFWDLAMMHSKELEKMGIKIPTIEPIDLSSIEVIKCSVNKTNVRWVTETDGKESNGEKE